MLLAGILLYVVERWTGVQDRGAPGVLLRVGGMILLMIWSGMSRLDKRTDAEQSPEGPEKNGKAES